MKLYDQMLATPLTTLDVARGEIAWSQLRGSAYAAAFLVIMTAMGLVHSWWAVLAFPATLLIGFASSAVCMAATTYMKSWQDFDKITLVQLPMFLFSGTFFPISAFPTPVQWVVECTPLYRGVVLCRELTTGALTWASAVSVVYLRADGAGRAARRAPAARCAAADLTLVVLHDERLPGGHRDEAPHVSVDVLGLDLAEVGATGPGCGCVMRMEHPLARIV